MSAQLPDHLLSWAHAGMPQAGADRHRGGGTAAAAAPPPGQQRCRVGKAALQIRCAAAGAGFQEEKSALQVPTGVTGSTVLSYGLLPTWLSQHCHWQMSEQPTLICLRVLSQERVQGDHSHPRLQWKAWVAE